MKIWISNRQRKTALNPERVKKRAGKILNALGWSEAELSLTLLGDRAMARLNRETFGRRGPTNVIAFPVDDPGDLPESMPEATPAPEGPASPCGRTAPGPGRSGHLPRDHPPPGPGIRLALGGTLRLFLIHGILHLLGHDHDTPEKRRP